MSTKEYPRLLGEGILNSYSQIFFSNNKLFAVLLLVASFVDMTAGFAGLLAIIITQGVALSLGFSKELVRDGTYTYNGLMVGLVIGFYYQINTPFFVMLAFASILCFFLTIWLASSAGKHNIPFLSVPFLLAVWAVLLSGSNFAALELNVRGIEDFTRFFFLGDQISKDIYVFVEKFDVPYSEGEPLGLAYMTTVYLKSLGAIMFQYNLPAGILIAAGLFYYSRMAFSLSIIGFTVGYLFYYYLQGDLSNLYYTYVGFNFILTAIALGGFFLVPSWKSYLTVALMMPLIAILIAGLDYFLYFKLHFYRAELPMYSLPFNLVVMLTLITLHLRTSAKGLHIVALQNFSPEKNHYKFYNSMQRFKNNTYFHVSLPFMGEWKVSQGHDGDVTHKQDWKEALDFVIEDDLQQTFRQPGATVADFYCYAKPVLCPADGIVVEVKEGIEDNEIGGMNLNDNWGNTVVIKHGEYFYSKLSHFKPNSIKVKVNDRVGKGEILGLCGNSGRSPEPHIHFQMQATPYIGSKTLDYPISYYMTNENGQHQFHSFDVPEEGQIISNVTTSKSIKDAFDFIPGKTLTFEVDDPTKGKYTAKWEVFTNAFNNSYLYCHQTKSVAYFVNNGPLFYFTDFEGDRKSLMYQFYIGAQRVLMGYYKNIELNDKLQSTGFYNGLIQTLQDLVAPFYHFLSVDYSFRFKSVDNDHQPKTVELESIAESKILGKEHRKIDYLFTLSDGQLQNLTISENDKTISATCVSA